MLATLRRGNRSPEVAQLQRLLNQKLIPSPNLTADGAFGPRTEDAVRRFQTQHRLSADGIVGPQTWARLNGATVPTTGTSEPQWMQVARRESGVREIAGSAHNPRIIAYHATTSLKATTDETAWCASFVNWCLRQAGVAGTNSAAAASFVTWGKETVAQPGAVCVIYNSSAANTSLSRSGNHVAFLVEETPANYVLLGGNQSDSVKISNFSKAMWQLKAMRWAP
jgi:uncharacterized protein (TIGR02594 family)